MLGVFAAEGAEGGEMSETPLLVARLRIAELEKALALAKQEAADWKQLWEKCSQSHIEQSRELAEAQQARERLFGDGMIAHRWFATWFGEGVNGRDFEIKCPMATRQMEESKAERDTLRGLLREAQGAMKGSLGIHANHSQCACQFCSTLERITAELKEGR